MKKVLIVYYSHTGNNLYLAKKLSADLKLDTAEIKPRGCGFIIQLMLSQLKFSFGLSKLEFDLKKYQKVVLVGPVWTGQLIAPLRTFLKHYKDHINELYFLTCCGSTDTDKDGKWGYGQVFRRINDIMGSKCRHCAALPITLVIPEEKHDDGDFVMKTRLSDDNFKGEIRDRYQNFVSALVN